MSRLRNSRLYDLNKQFVAVHCREFRWLEKGWTLNRPSPRKGKSVGSSEHYAENRDRNRRRAASVIRRLIIRYDLSRLLTLTFAENVMSVKDADKRLRCFLKMLRVECGESLQYLWVREFQDRGAVHYHIALNQYVPKKKLQEFWKEGFLDIRRTGSSQRAARYLCKYVSKGINNTNQSGEDDRLKHYHLYGHSQAMEIPGVDRQCANTNEFHQWVQQHADRKGWAIKWKTSYGEALIMVGGGQGLHSGLEPDLRKK